MSSDLRRASAPRFGSHLGRHAGFGVAETIPARSQIRFKVDFISWPDDHRRNISEAHLVLGAVYLDQERVDLLRTTLKDCMVKLV